MKHFLTHPQPFPTRREGRRKNRNAVLPLKGWVTLLDNFAAEGKKKSAMGMKPIAGTKMKNPIILP